VGVLPKAFGEEVGFAMATCAFRGGRCALVFALGFLLLAIPIMVDVVGYGELSHLYLLP
jgi:hypothetical protein